jgi:hypothetical protein
MIFLALFIGILLPLASGMMMLRLFEGSRILLTRIERVSIGWITGITVSMFLLFFANAFLHMPLSKLWMSAVQVVLLIILFVLMRVRHLSAFPSSQVHSLRSEWRKIPMWLRGILIGMGFWSLVKIAAMLFLLLATPTFFDDAIENWNVRGKIFFIDQSISLMLPHETEPGGVSSYPPTVPLAKTWVSSLAGRWSEPVINGIHILWYFAAIGIVFSILRRAAGLLWALIGSYALMSLPLYLMHGANPYADVFLSCHIAAAVGMLFCAERSTEHEVRMGFLRLCALLTALLPFTKNEGLLIYLPPLILLIAFVLFRFQRAAVLSSKEFLRTALLFAVPLALVAGPWILFKWMNGLPFGNAKAVAGFSIGWQENVLRSVTINTVFEGNWLLLFPLIIVLLAIVRRESVRIGGVILLFIGIVYFGQMFLYLFTTLSSEALEQTGYARGLVHIMPLIVILTTLLTRKALEYWGIATSHEDHLA